MKLKLILGHLVVWALLCAAARVAAAPGLPTEHQQITEQIWQVAAVAEDEMFYHVYSAIIWNESRFRHDVINYNCDGSFDYGVAQLNSRSFSPDVLHRGMDPRTAVGNARIGARFFFSLVKQFDGDYELAVMAYNCGPNAVRRGLIPDVTRKYRDRVMSRAYQSLMMSRD